MPLVESLRNEVVCSEHDIAAYVPDPPGGLLPVDRAIALALRHTRECEVSTRWSSAATPGAPSDPLPTDPSWAGGSLYVDARTSVVRASTAELWRVIEGIGGETGWYSFPAAWAVRGLADRLSGGVGLRRGRRDPRRLLVGDALDFWRVEAITPGSLLRLRAEMKLPGLAWLELAAGRDRNGRTTYRQRAIFQPRGLAGHVYWRSISPFHGVVFGGMLRNITAAAERADRDGEQLFGHDRDPRPAEPTTDWAGLLAGRTARQAAPVSRPWPRPRRCRCPSRHAPLPARVNSRRFPSRSSHPGHRG
jgi:hypothetical protein